MASLFTRAVSKDTPSKDVKTSLVVPSSSALSPPEDSKFQVVSIKKFNLLKSLPVSRRRGRRARAALQAIALPREIMTFPIIPLTLRFVSSAAVTSSTGIITVADVFGAIGVIGRVTNTSVTALATAFRLKRILMYPSVKSNFTYSSVECIWFGAEEDREPDIEKNRARPGGVNTPEVGVFVPPKNALVSQWYRDTYAEATQSIAICMSTSTDSVLDVDLDFTLPTAITGSQVINVSTAVVGTFYRLSINRTAGGTWVPIDYNTTT